MWIVRLTDKQLEVLRAMLRSEEHLGPALRGALEALELARWDELPDAQLPWESVADEARRQGVSEAEVVWDICGRHRRTPGAASQPRRQRQRRLIADSYPSVGVEAAAALAAQPALGDQLAQTLRRTCVGLAAESACRLSPIATATSRPTKSSSLSGPIGCPAPSCMQSSTSAGVHAGRLQQPHGLEEVAGRAAG